MRSPLDGPLRSFLSPFGVGGGAPAATLYAVQQYNVAELSGYNVTLSADTDHWGDSLTQGVSLTPWTQWVDDYVTNTVTNDGISGERLVDEIYGRLVAASAAKKARITSIQGGTNDANQNASPVYSTVITAFDSCVAELTTSNYWVMSGTFSGDPSVGAQDGHDRGVINASLLSTYGDQYIAYQFPFWGAVAEATWTTNEKNQVMRGQVPDSLQLDATHPNATGIDALGQEFARMTIALGGGPAYPHSDIAYLDEAAATGATIHTVRRLGTPSSWEIVSSDAPDVATIDASGVLKRGTGAITGDYTNVRVRANSSGGAKQDSIVRLMRGGDGNFAGATIPLNGGFAVVDPPTFTDFTFIIGMKYPVGVGSACRLFQGDNASSFASSYGSGGNIGKCQFNLANAAGSTITTSAPGPAPADQEEWYWIGISYSQSTPTCKVIANNTAQTKTVTLADDVSFGEFLMLFVGTSSYGNSAPRDVRRLLIYDHYWDLGSGTERAKFFNTTTFAPAAIGSGGEVDAITPFLGFDVHGVGDLMPDQWYGTAARRVWNQPWLNSLAYTEAA